MTLKTNDKPAGIGAESGARGSLSLSHDASDGTWYQVMPGGAKAAARFDTGRGRWVVVLEDDVLRVSEERPAKLSVHQAVRAAAALGARAWPIGQRSGRRAAA